MNLYLLVNVALHLDVHRIVPLELSSAQPRILIITQLHCPLLSVLSFPLPINLLYDVVNWNVNRGALQPQRSNKSLGADFLSLLVQVKIDKAFDNFLFEPFASGSRSIDFDNLVAQVFNLSLGGFLHVDAFFKLFMNHVICESSQRGCEMRIAL